MMNIYKGSGTGLTGNRSRCGKKYRSRCLLQQRRAVVEVDEKTMAATMLVCKGNKNKNPKPLALNPNKHHSILGSMLGSPYFGRTLSVEVEMQTSILHPTPQRPQQHKQILNNPNHSLYNPILSLYHLIYSLT